MGRREEPRVLELQVRPRYVILFIVLPKHVSLRLSNIVQVYYHSIAMKTK